VVDAAWADNGPGWAVVMLASAARVLALRPPASRGTHIEVGVVGPHPSGSEAAFEVRAFFTDHHGVVREDPVTGSLNASIAQWLFATQRASRAYVAAQGAKVGHAGRIHLSQDDTGAVWVGGDVRDISAGPFRL
jgi:predicted PhzF superfamily epimerase YddE/YHI9